MKPIKAILFSAALVACSLAGLADLQAQAAQGPSVHLEFYEPEENLPPYPQDVPTEEVTEKMHFQTLLFLDNFPKDKLIVGSLLRPLFKSTPWEQKDFAFFINRNNQIMINNKVVGSALPVPSKRFFPGEEIEYCFKTEDSSFELRQKLVPHPILAGSVKGSFQVEAKLTCIHPTSYALYVRNLTSDAGTKIGEKVMMMTQVGKEVVTTEYVYNEPLLIVYTPDTLNEESGTSYLRIATPNDSTSFYLPWGKELLKYVGKPYYCKEPPKT